MSSIRIMGAGPAGLMAAITLAHAGREVVVYERGGDVGSRREGDLEALENFMFRRDALEELASWGVRPDFPYTPLHALTCFGPGLRQSITGRDTTPFLYFVRRGSFEGSFDRALLEQAQAAGVRVEFNRPAKPEEVDIVAAGLKRPRAFAVGYNFDTSAPPYASLCLDAKLAPYGYAYLVSGGGHGTIATASLAGTQGMREKLARVVELYRSRVEFDMRKPRYFAASVTFGLPQTGVRNGKLHAGEAGEFQDGWTGFGMRIAMATGRLAACSILEGSDYDRLWMSRLRGLSEAAVVNRVLQSVLGDTSFGLVRLLAWGRLDQARALLYRQYNRSWYTPLLYPLARLIVRKQLER